MPDRQPVEKVERPRREISGPGTVWTTDQLKAFLQYAREHRLWPFLHLAAYTGARRGELLHLRWPDVDLDAKQLVIRGSASFIDGSSSLFPILIKRCNQAHPNDRLPHARLHDLRHIHATTLLLAGVPIHVVAARLGHADPSITLRVYAHVIRAAEASAADVVAQAIDE
ncbi:site-specific integrase [Nonomuraea glycinis]|nr:site-specific integrase [Nonomuraea glycinis]MCA2181163.1 site-specific integrase [Nonomuraea glycinis]